MLIRLMGLGFQVVFHPCNPKARIKHSEINLSIYSDEDDHESENPVIKVDQGFFTHLTLTAFLNL